MPLADDIRAAGVCAYVKEREKEREREREKTDARQHHGNAAAASKRDAGGGDEENEGGPSSSRELEAATAVRLLAPWSLPTRLPARVPQQLADLLLPYVATLRIHTSVTGLFARLVSAPKQRLRENVARVSP